MTTPDLAPPPFDDAQRIAAELPYADILLPFLELFWVLKGAEASADDEEKARVSEFLALVQANGKRLEELEEDADAWSSFVDEALLPQLDALGQCISRTSSPTLSEHLLRILYVRLGATLQARGIGSLLRVVPGRDPFDATLHKAQGSAEGPAGVVVELLRVGLRDARTGALLRPAEVLVGK